MKEHGEKLDDPEKESLTEKVQELKKAKESGSVDNIKSAMESLNAFWSTVASKMYDSAKQEEDASGGESTDGTDTKKKKESEIEDADFEVVD